MPPSNSRATSPPTGAEVRAGTPSYLTALRDLGPVNQDVLNLAATLTTQSEEDDDDDDDDDDDYSPDPAQPFPRAHGDDVWRPALSGERTPSQRDELDPRDRLRRVMNRLSRIHDAPAAYGDRIPSQNNLYDWSPANEADDEEELDHILAELRREQPNTHPEILRVLGRSQLDTEREQRMRSYSSTLLHSNQPSAADTSLRSAAILQSARRHARFSARTRDYMQRHNADRESGSRSPHHSESRDRYAGTDPHRQAVIQRLTERRASLERERERDRSRDRSRDRDMLSRVDSFRRSYLERTSSAPSPACPLLEQTIKYLSRIRHSNTVDDSLDCAYDAGFLGKDHFRPSHHDFVLDTFTLPPPAETSWLAPGAVLSGCQHATTVTTTVTSTAGATSNTLYRFRNGESMSSTLFDPGRPWLSHNYPPAPHRRSMHSSGPETVTSHTPQQDRWPVKVTIHAVDYNKMSLAATMEAYNVPSHPHTHQSLSSYLDNSTNSPFTRTSSITTYLEGEILDFNQHTLLTESFKSDASNDATYWRKLPCFQKYTDEELVRNLTSKRFFQEVLCKEWILMRWKERCFVKSLSNSRTNTNPAQNSNSVQPPSDHRPMVVDSFHTTASSNEQNHDPGAETWAPQEEQATTFDDSGCGLTISGFYYVCLRRSDGKVEGLYYDPMSSPYQCLKLDSVNGGVFPSWGFR